MTILALLFSTTAFIGAGIHWVLYARNRTDVDLLVVVVCTIVGLIWILVPFGAEELPFFTLIRRGSGVALAAALAAKGYVEL
jgi:hypothetical protein